MAAPLKLFVLAGEASGDRLGADLIRRLRARIPLALAGVGGDEMQALGIKSLFPMSDLAVMGISDVLRRLPLLLGRIRQTARAILHDRPDVVVLIDSQDFSRLLAKRLRRSDFGGRLILYVAPTVWARAPERAKKLSPLFDEVLAVLPFEPAVMARLGGPPTRYVGHPALFEQHERPVPDRGLVMLLPGSRDGELRRHLPLLRSAAEALAGDANFTGFALPTLPSLRERLEHEVARWSVPVQVVADRAERHVLYDQAILALAVSGTVTLELALARVPMAVSYVMDRHQARIYTRMGSPPVSLPNIILDRRVVPEHIEAVANPSALLASARHLLENKKARQAQVACFGELADLMARGEPDYPIEDPANRILNHWHLSGR